MTYTIYLFFIPIAFLMLFALIFINEIYKNYNDLYKKSVDQEMDKRRESVRAYLQQNTIITATSQIPTKLVKAIVVDKNNNIKTITDLNTNLSTSFSINVNTIINNLQQDDTIYLLTMRGNMVVIIRI
jgi:cbb3-type cytochrome oxidase subunit 3